MLRVGLIGLGVMGKNHYRVLSSLDGINLVGVFDSALDSNFDVKVDLRANSLEDLLSRTLDYCVIASPTVTHKPLAITLSERGIHCLIEKPLAENAQAAEELVRAFRNANLIGAVGHIERFNVALQEARRRIVNDQLGKVLQIATRRQGPFPSRVFDVGVARDLASHDVDLTSWLVGSPYQSINAQSANISGRTHEDLLLSMGVLQNGVITNHIINWVSPVKERVVTITGEKGTLVVDTLTSDLSFFANGSIQVSRTDLALFRGVTEGDVTRYALPKPEPLKIEHEVFRNSILGISSDIVTLEEGHRNVQYTDAMLRSAELKGMPVYLPQEVS